MIIWFIIGAVISVGIIFGTLQTLKKSVASSIAAERTTIVEQIDESSTSLTELAEKHEGFASKAQLESLDSRITDMRTSLESERSALGDIESKLETAQKTVEGKEAHQQEIKSAKEEDEIKLEELISTYDNVSTESIELEQRLAASLKNLDAMAAEAGIDPALKAMLEDLSNSLTNAGSRLRDLLTEYQTVNERIQTLKAQHEDLEEEYTRLVEQQLGD